MATTPRGPSRFRASRRNRWLGALAASGLVFSLASSAHGSPAVEGTRNVATGNMGRASAYGTSAALLSPAAMSFSQQFAIEPMYQLAIQSRRHGIGVVVMDSLNNPRAALALGYLFMRGSPSIKFRDVMGQDQKLKLSHFGHEAFAAISIAIVKQWLAVAVKPKYQYSSLRFRDLEGIARNANHKLNFFGLDTAVGLNLAGWVAFHVVAYNLVGNYRPAFTCLQDIGCESDRRDLNLTGLDADPSTVERGMVSRVSDYPLQLAHALSVFPLNRPHFSLNFDGTYDFTSYWNPGKYARMQYGGSGEYIVGPVPIRFGSYWDGMGPGGDDDRVYVAGGVGYVKPAQLGGVGVDVGFGFRQQVVGPGQKETILGFNLGLRIHPDL